jgi:hypothetical protein
MPFKSPIKPKLTENQNKALAKINSIRKYAESAGGLSFGKFNKNRSFIGLNVGTDLPSEQQISTFDLCLSIIDAVKPGASDLITQQFLSKIFAVTGPDSTVLEGIIIKALANALDKNGKKLAPQPLVYEESQDENISNEESGVVNDEEQESLSQTDGFQQFEWLEYKIILKSQVGDNYVVEVINNSSGKVPFFEILEENASEKFTLDPVASGVSIFEQIKSFYLRKLSPGSTQVGGLNDSFVYKSVTYPFSGTKISDINAAVGTIKGVVFSTDNNETVPGAKVELLNSNPPIQLITDINGEFKIENVNFGQKTIKVSYDFGSFKEVEIEVNVTPEVITEVQIPLEFQGIVVSSEGDTSVEGENDQFSVKYSFELSRPLIRYIFTKEIDENNNLVKLKVETRYTDIEVSESEVVNSSQFPNFEIIVDSLEDEDDLGLDEILELEQVNIPDIDDLEFQADEIADSIRENGYSLLRSDGSALIYPSENTSDLEIVIKNNINLPEYNKRTGVLNANSEIAQETFENEISKDREVNEVFYPKEGTVGLIFEGQFQTLENNNNTTSGDSPPEGSVNASENNFTTVPTETPEPTPFSFFGFREEDIGLTNQQYLTKYLLPALTFGKRALVAKIITMIFGSKEKMDNNPELQNILLNSAACGEQMFSVYNNPSISEAELEYNKIKLRERLEKGKIELTISCQKIEISLPENYLQEFDLEDSEIIGVSEQDRPNPAVSFVLLQNFVENELQKQRSDEDASAVRRSFLQIIIDKIIQYVGIAFATNPEMSQIMGFINFELSKSGQSPISAKDLCSSPCEIVNACQSNNKEEFEKKSAFNDVLLNSLLALVLSLLIPKIINECKLIINRYITQKAIERIAKLRLRQQKRFEQFNQNTGFVDKATQYKNEFENSGIDEILNFIKSQENKPI